MHGPEGIGQRSPQGRARNAKGKGQSKGAGKGKGFARKGGSAAAAGAAFCCRRSAAAACYNLYRHGMFFYRMVYGCRRRQRGVSH